MTAPLAKSTGAPLAQNACATEHAALKGKPSGAKRATALLPVAQRSKLGLTRRSGQRRETINIGGMK